MNAADGDRIPKATVAFLCYDDDAVTVLASHECTTCKREHVDRLHLAPHQGRPTLDVLVRTLRALRFSERCDDVTEAIDLVRCVDDTIGGL